MRLITVFIFVFVLLPINNAQELIPDSKGFSGFILPEFGYSISASNLYSTYLGMRRGNDQINSLLDKPKDVGTPYLTLPFQISYTLREGKTSVFIGNSTEDLFRFNRSNQLAIRQRFKANGIFQLGLCIEDLALKTWQDPFIIGKKRTATPLFFPGIRLEWIQIKGTEARLSYSYIKQIIGSEESGSQLDLPLPHLNDLKRNGALHQIEFSYKHKLNESNSITPILSYSKSDFDGSAINFMRYFVGINYILLNKNYSFQVEAAYYYKENNEPNPVFYEQEKGFGYQLNFRFLIDNPWGISIWGQEPIKLDLSGASDLYSPNIDFYKEQFIALQVGILKSW